MLLAVEKLALEMSGLLGLNFLVLKMSTTDLLSMDIRFTCKHCGRNENLDFEECSVKGGKHEISFFHREAIPLDGNIDQRPSDVESISNQRPSDASGIYAERLFSQMVLTEEEYGSLGVVGNGVLQLEAIIDDADSTDIETFETVEDVLFSDIDLPNFLKFKYSKQICQKLRDREEAEKEFEKEANKKAEETIKELKKTRTIRPSSHAEVLQEIYNRSSRQEVFVNLFPLTIFQQAISVGDKKNLINHPDFLKFVDEIVKPILAELIDTDEYIRYIKEELFGETFEDLLGLAIKGYTKEVMYQFGEANGNTPRSAFFGSTAFDTVLELRVPILIIKDINRFEARKYFTQRLINFKKSSSNINREYINHISDYIAIKALKERNSITALPPMPFKKSKYLMKTTASSQKPHLQDYDISMSEIVLKYKFELSRESGQAKRIATQYGNRSYKNKEVSDLFHFYTTFQTSEDVLAVVYKDKKEHRVKRYSVEIEIPEETHHHEYFAVYFNEKPVAKEQRRQETAPRNQTVVDSTASASATSAPGIPDSPQASRNGISNQSEMPRIIFDLASGKCHITGTKERIISVRTLFKKRYSIELMNPEFISFKGSFSVKTKAVLSKDVFAHCLKLPILSRYWLVKDIKQLASNYNYVYDFEDQPNHQTSTNKYISLIVQPGKCVGILDNTWTIQYDGNDNTFMIPFVSMFIGLIQLLENADQDSRLELFHKKQEAFLEALVRKKNKITSSDLSLISCALREINKKDIYNMALKEAFNEIKMSGVLDALPDDVVDEYENHAKPFWVRTPLEGGRLRRWKQFYISALLEVNPLLKKQVSQTLINPSAEVLMKNSLDKLEDKFALNLSNKIRLAKPTNSSEPECLSIYESIEESYPLAMVFGDFLFFTYPDKSIVHLIGRSKKRGLPIRVSDAVRMKDDKVNKYSRNAGSMNPRKKAMQGAILEIIQAFGLFPSSISEYNPAEGQRFLEDFLIRAYQISDKRKQADDEEAGNRVLKALVAQHTWDIPMEEIHSVFREINIELQQDLLQNYHDALILYYDYDTEDREYKFKFPRHKLWYAVNQTYENVMFIFRSRQSKSDKGVLEIVNFPDPNKTAKNAETQRVQKNKAVNHFFKTAYLTQRSAWNHKSVTYDDFARLPNDVKVDGQFFDSNGKCSGFRFRIHRGGTTFSFLDTHITPQEPVLPRFREKKFEAKFVSTENHDIREANFGYITDIRTTVSSLSEIGRLDDGRFTLIEKPVRVVQNDIHQMYNDTRQWKQDVYLFVRMVISHWIYSGRPEPENHLDTYIQVADSKKPLEKVQELERTTIIPIFKSEEPIKEFESFLLKAYPNRFYSNDWNRDSGVLEIDTKAIDKELGEIEEKRSKLNEQQTTDLDDSEQEAMNQLRAELRSREKDLKLLRTQSRKLPVKKERLQLATFRVDGNEIVRMRSYILREIEVMKSAPENYFDGFINTRLDIRLMPPSQNELIGEYNISKVKETFKIKNNFETDELCFYTNHFNVNLDPRRSAIQADSKELTRYKPHKLLLMHVHIRKPQILGLKEKETFDRKLVLVRLTFNGTVETARFICSKWSKYRRIMSYDEEREKNTPTRMFSLQDDNTILEDSDNKLTDDDSWIFQYHRGKTIYVALLPLD